MAAQDLAARKPSRLVAATSTSSEYFPKTTAFELQSGQRPFAIAAESRPPGAPPSGTSELFIITPDGELRELASKSGQFQRGGNRPSIVLDELGGGTVIRMTAFPVYTTTYVVVVGQKAGGDPVVIALEGTEREWRRIALPLDAEGVQTIVRARASGFAAVDKAPVYYASAPGPGRNLIAFTFANSAATPRTFEESLLQDLKAKRIVTIDHEFGVLGVGGVALIFQRLGGARSQWRVGVDPGPIDAAHLVPIHDGYGACHGAFLRTAEDALYATWLGRGLESNGMTLVTGGARGPQRAVDVAYSTHGDGDLHVFVLDAAGIAWYGHCSRNGDWSAIEWQPTGHKAVNLEAPPLSGDVPYVIADSRQGRLDQLIAGEPGEVWTRVALTLAEPKPAPVLANVHRITLTAVTSAKVAVARVKLDVRAERPLIVEHDGVLYQLGPDRAETFETNYAGKLALRTPANGVDTPAILVSAPEVPLVEERFQLQETALRRLAGEQLTVTALSLKSQGLVPATMSEADATEVATAIRAAASASLARAESAGGAMSFRRAPLQRSAAGVTIVRNGDDFYVERDTGTTSFRSAVPGLDGDPSPETESSAGAFWSWIKGAWDTVKKIALEVVEGTMRLVATAADRVVQFVTDAARYIADGVHALLSWVGKLGGDLADVGAKVVRFVVSFLDWEDVVRCKNVVKNYMLATLTDFEAIVRGPLPAAVSARIRDLRTEANRIFDDVLLSKPVREQPRAGDAAGKREAALRQHGSTMTLFHDAIPSTASAGTAPALTPGLQEKIETLKRHALELANGESFRAELTRLESIFHAEMTAAEIAQMTIAAVIHSVRPLVMLALDAVDVIQTLVFQLLADLIASVREAWTTPLAGAGWIDTVYRELSGGEPLTLLDLGCLLFVTPGVIAHHALTHRRVIEAPGTTPAPTTTKSFLGVVDQGLLSGTTEAALADASFRSELETTRAHLAAVTAVTGLVLPWYYLVRGVVSFGENAQRLLEVQGTPSTWAGEIISTVLAIIDFIDTVVSIASAVLYAVLPFSEFRREIIGIFLTVALVIVAVQFLQLALRRIPDAVASMLASAVLTAVTGACLFVIDGAALLFWLFGNVARSDREKMRNVLPVVGNMARDLSSPVAVGIPLSARWPEGATRAGLIAVNFGGDWIGVTLCGFFGLLPDLLYPEPGTA